MVKIAEQASSYDQINFINHSSITAEAAGITEGDASETAKADSFTKSPLAETKDYLLGYLGTALTVTVAGFGGLIGRTQTAKNIATTATTAVRATKTAAKVSQVAKAAQNFKLIKSVFTWVSRGAKAVGVVAAPFTGGVSLAAGIAASVALDVVAEEAIDAYCTYANGGQVVAGNEGNMIQIGEKLGAMFA